MPVDTMAQERARARMRKPEPSFYLEQKKLEYKTFAKEYVQPVLESGVAVYEKEKAKEEAVIEEAWKAEVTTAEEEAALAFEASLEAAKATIEPEIPIEQITAWEQKERTRFQEELSAWRSKQTVAYEEYIQEWRRQWRPKGLAQRMVEWRVPTTPGDWITGITTPTKAPLAPLAGMVASVESFVYGVTGLAGVETPRPPPTPTGAVISQYVFGKPEEMKALKQYPREYVGGALIGDFILSVAIGKGVEKVAIKPLSPYVSKAWRWVQTKAGWIKKPIPMPSLADKPAWISQEDWYKFYVQTARATTRPVRVRPEYVRVPWMVTRGETITPMAKTLMKVTTKYPPTPVAGGLTVLQEVTEQVAVRYPFSLKTAVAAHLLATAPKPTYPITIGLPLVLGTKAIPTPRAVAVVKPSPLERTILRPFQEIPQIVTPEVEERIVPVVRAREEQIVQTLQRSQLAQQILTVEPSFQRFRPPAKRRREVRRKKKKKKVERKPLKWERYEIIYPVKGVSEVAKHILS